jgi:hypothetical protein
MTRPGVDVPVERWRFLGVTGALTAVGVLGRGRGCTGVVMPPRASVSRSASPSRPLPWCSCGGLAVDPVATGVSVAVQPSLLAVAESASMLGVDSVDELTVRVMHWISSAARGPGNRLCLAGERPLVFVGWMASVVESGDRVAAQCIVRPGP